MSTQDLIGYVVIHEYTFRAGDVGVNTASSVYPTREPAENALAYCEGMQEQRRPGSEGDYYIARVIRDSDDPAEDMRATASRLAMYDA